MSSPFDGRRYSPAKIGIALFLCAAGAAVTIFAARRLDRIVAGLRGNQAAPPPAVTVSPDALTAGNIAASALRRAATTGNAAAARAALARGILADHRDRLGNTPLCLAARNGRIQVMQVLLQAGADPNARCVAGRTPLHFAAEGHQLGAVIELLSRHADATSRDSAGQTPGDLAARRPGPILQQFAACQVLQLAELAAAPSRAN
jgi:hypothetical protein